MDISQDKDEDVKDQLPDGYRPLWIDAPCKDTPKIEMMQKVADLEELNNNSYTVTVISIPVYKGQDQAIADDIAVESWCIERKWRYVRGMDMYGCEDECIVILDNQPISLESASRAMNLCVYATRPNG